ncbi:MAG: peptidylprolyl isomerase [Nanoarchaeota archaeon]|jgi:FKBP-type peptidyl-prolyl cis-trans isomerase 2|nr:peptidylprolyl isomerase [Nanoarchaeota archaeon]|tara:strand:+ start:6172 stop:6606 length:435 start_codon:yes stop_codon:yes gene_type:complete
MRIKKGDKIKVDYEGTFDDGKVFDSSKHGDHSHPLEFEVGKGMVIKGFDEAVVGMELNEEKEIKLTAEEAYGNSDPKKIVKIPREKLPKDQEPQVGMMLGMQTQDGKQVGAKILEVGDKEITIDLNHPLAGKNLNFKIKVIEIN